MRLATGARRALGVLAYAAAMTAPLCASAQPFSDEHVQGVVQSFDGQERLTLRDDRGFIDDVSLGDQTRVTPEGVRLAPGMRVAITGYNGGKWLDATAITIVANEAVPAPNDAPSYAQSNGGPSYQYPYQQAYSQPYPPVYAYPYPVYAPVYAYPYPAYGPYYGPYYGGPYYGPRVSVGVGFNYGGRWGGRWGGWHR